MRAEEAARQHSARLLSLYNIREVFGKVGESAASRPFRQLVPVRVAMPPPNHGHEPYEEQHGATERVQQPANDGHQTDDDSHGRGNVKQRPHAGHPCTEYCAAPSRPRVNADAGPWPTAGSNPTTEGTKATDSPRRHGDERRRTEAVEGVDQQTGRVAGRTAGERHRRAVQLKAQTTTFVGALSCAALPMPPALRAARSVLCAFPTDSAPCLRGRIRYLSLPPERLRTTHRAIDRY